MRSPLRFLGLAFFSIGNIILVGGGLLWLGAVLENSSWEVEEQWIGAVSFSAMGLIFAAIGGGVLWNQCRLRLKREMLMRTGRKLKATVTELALNHRITVNNRHPHIVKYTAVYSGKERTFESTNIYGSVKLNYGDPLDVFIDFRDDNNYWVEIPEDAIR